MVVVCALDSLRTGALILCGATKRDASEFVLELEVGREVGMDGRLVPDDEAPELDEVTTRSCSTCHDFLVRRGAGRAFGAAVGVSFMNFVGIDGSDAGTGLAAGRLNTGSRISGFAALSSVCSIEGAGFGGAESNSQIMYGQLKL
jgi:hypothetical protein